MKKIIILLVAVTMLGSFLFAEENVEEVTEMEIIKIIKIEDLDDLENVENLEELEKLGVDLEKILEQNHIQIVGDGIDYCETPFMGIYFGNLSLEKANELSFNKEYGVLINGVVENSPAKFYRLLKDDIIMAVDDKQVKNENAITKIISSYYVGDKVKLSIFRDGEMKDVDFVFGSRNSDVTADGKVIKKIIKKKKKSVGYGGGSWIPVWFKPDLANVNEILGNLDVGELPETGFLTQGGGGKGNVGNGYFIGGMGVGYTTNFTNEIEENDEQFTRKVDYDFAFGGVTLDKRVAISRKIVFGFGCLLGGAENSITVSKIDGNVDWNGLETNQSTSFKMSKAYFVVQPKFNVLFRLTSWLAIRGEVGYLKGYSPYNGWKYSVAENDFDIAGSPNTSIDGLSFSVGPWFGF
ncbi:MAG: PDZ domain-containing protein [Candidatus Cloacimonetes bacterium]|nr:PDZ domain-containing protein [Candidatus Cloacimonadota bacterium]MBT6993764.1 PDZ domain-containing protein [Candidatus Cloacimonadota bacterium]MBT7469936.1 PDZ domain-containing protein [Candidatus Cloacimonadota bacterium]